MPLEKIGYGRVERLNRLCLLTIGSPYPSLAGGERVLSKCYQEPWAGDAGRVWNIPDFYGLREERHKLVKMLFTPESRNILCLFFAHLPIGQMREKSTDMSI